MLNRIRLFQSNHLIDRMDLIVKLFKLNPLKELFLTNAELNS